MPKRKTFPKIDVIVYGSSHVKPNHYLPEHLEEIFKNHNRFKEPVEYGVGGAWIDPEFVNIVKEEITKNADNPTAIVLIIGSNNLRYGEQTPQEVLPLFEDLVHHASFFPKCHVVLTSILPSPSTDEFSAGPFRTLSNFLRDLSNKKNYENRVSFCNVAHTLLADENNYDPKDYLHLSYEGAGTFARCLKNHLEQRQQICFSSNPKKIKKK